MAYVDYSAQFVLDMFFTYLNANQLGSNDEHLYDTIAAEHNINISTVDGTHKGNSILGSYINKTIIASSASQAISALSAWIPTAGVYQVVPKNALSSDNDESSIVFQIFVGGVWTPISIDATVSNFLGGIYFCDGTNMRFYNLDGSATHYIAYQQF